MSQTLLDTRTVGLLAGVLYLLLPMGGWLILRRQDDPVRLAMWTIGSMCISAHAALTSLITVRDIPPALMITLVGTGYLGYMLRAGALLLHLGEALPWRRLLVLLLLLLVGFEITRQTSVHARSTYGLTFTMLCVAWQSAIAQQVARRLSSACAQAMAIVYGLLAMAMAVRVARMLLGQGGPLILGQDLDSLSLPLIGVFSAVFNTIAYIGVTLENVHTREMNRVLEMDRIRQAQRASQAQSEGLLALLRERDEMLHLLAHEVRQPLNNASAALQSARSVATEAAVHVTPRLVGRLDRAQSVILQITSILDNTLAATTLLSADSQLAPVEADLETLVELCLADIAPTSRLRIRVAHDPGLRTAAFDPGLMRLALRNLLVNALAYSPAGSEVVLRLTEREEPLAILFEVSDQGVGIADEFKEQVFERGVRGPQTHKAGLGLGLYIVRRVAELHRGTVEILPSAQGRTGATLRLTIPQGGPCDADLMALTRQATRNSARNT